MNIHKNENESIGESDHLGVNATCPCCKHGVHMLSISACYEHLYTTCMPVSLFLFFLFYLSVTHTVFFLSLSVPLSPFVL